MSEVYRSKRQKNGEMICSVGRRITETSSFVFSENSYFWYLRRLSVQTL